MKKLNIICAVSLILLPSLNVWPVQGKDSGLITINEISGLYNIVDVGNCYVLESTGEAVMNISGDFGNRGILQITLRVSNIRLFTDQPDKVIDDPDTKDRDESVDNPLDKIEFKFIRILPDTEELLSENPALFIVKNRDYVIAIVHTSKNNQDNYICS